MGGARRRPDANLCELWLIGLADAAEALNEIELAQPRLPVAPEMPAASGKRLSHIALRILLERAYGPEPVRRVPFRRSARGKPALTGIPGEFSLAHTAEFALVGVNACGPIGVDLEQPRSLSMSTSRLEAIMRAAARLSASARSPSATDPLQAWTRLEAIAKADGQGIGWALEAFGVRMRDREAENMTREGEELLRKLAVTDLDAGPGLYAAVALPRGVRVPDLQRFPGQTSQIARLLG